MPDYFLRNRSIRQGLRVCVGAITLLALLAAPRLAWGAGGGVPALEGGDIGLLWALPFAGILLSIALFPLVAPRFWHGNFGRISALWAVSLVIPMAFEFGWRVTLYESLHAMLLEYIPFILLLLSLYTVTGGIRIRGSMTGSPVVNCTILAVGTGLASWMGTTGAAMLLIRLLLRANAHRRYRVHTVVFFIFLVANIGGSLTPLGDPPLFLGFLKGVPFFWPTQHLFLPMLFASGVLLLVFFVLDSFLHKKEKNLRTEPPPSQPEEKFGIEGMKNFILLGGIIVAVLLSGVWQPGIRFEIFHVEVELQNLCRDLLLVLLVVVSLRMTSSESRKDNNFSWFPIAEVAKLFACIFLTIIPPIAILRAGQDGALAGLLALVTDESGAPNNAVYFWLCGLLSSFLDNAPTYLVFFNSAGGNAEQLIGPLVGTLTAISMGAVFMGANTYIGNAPNFMVRSIAEEGGVAMPSFFGYMVWSFGILTPLFFLAQLMFL